MSERPVPPEAPVGFAFVAAEEGPAWRTETGRRCRWSSPGPLRACGVRSVAAVDRGRLREGARVAGWWGYCEEHLRPRWIEDGKVMCWKLEKLPANAR